MRKKFSKDEPISNSSPKLDGHTTILEYIGSSASDILEPMSFMHLPPLEFWTKLFEHESYMEGKRPVKESIKWPYVERLVILARKFKSLSNEDRNFILSSRKSGVFWRGDDIEQFIKIVDSTLDYRDLTSEEKDKYRKNLLKMSSAFKNMYA